MSENFSPVVSIVIPCWDNLKYTQDCVNSILRRPPSCDFEIILINNGSSDGTAEYLDSLTRRDPDRFQVIHNAENLGFCTATNQGLKVARGHPLWLNNDTIVVQDGFFDTLLETLHRDSKCGAVGPISNYVMGCQSIHKNHAHPIAVHRSRFLVGFCLLVRKQAFDQVGLIDEQFGMQGNDDLDYSIRLRALGWELVVDRRAFLFHHPSMSIAKLGGYDTPQMKQGRELLHSKWGLPRVDELFLPLNQTWLADSSVGGIRILMVVPSYSSIEPVAYANHFGAFYEALEQFRASDMEILPMVIPRSDILRARTEAVEKTLRDGFTHLFFLDDDMLFQKNFSLQRMVSYGLPYVSGLCFMRTPPHYPSMFLDYGDPNGEVRYVSDWPEDALVRVDATGLACALIEAQTFLKVRQHILESPLPGRPLFAFGSARRGERHVGEDVYFGKLCGEAGIPIHVDTGVTFGHIGMAQVYDADTFRSFRDRARSQRIPFAGEDLRGGGMPHEPGSPPQGMVTNRDLPSRIVVPNQAGSIILPNQIKGMSIEQPMPGG